MKIKEEATNVIFIEAKIIGLLSLIMRCPLRQGYRSPN
jgi:hypothetical protein